MRTRSDFSIQWIDGFTSLEGILDGESFDRKNPRRLRDIPRVV